MNKNQRLKPNTEFMLYAPNYFSTDHLTILNELYLPLAKQSAIMTYVYLQQSSTRVTPLTIRFHREIMDELNTPLSDFSNQVEVLEALGLVRTYVSNHEHDDLLIYELVLPLSPEKFLNDPMLSLYLYNQVGEVLFKDKRERFIYPKLPSEVTEVTKKFTEVFKGKLNDSFTIPKGNYKNDKISEGPNVSVEDFDFDVLWTHLKGTKVDKKFFDKKTQHLIAQLSVLFDLNAYDMKYILMESTNVASGIDHKRLKQNARKYYKREHKERLPKFNNEVEDKSAEELDYFQALDDLSPLDRIGTIRNHKPTDEDLRLITDLITQTSLSKGVINILLEYIYQYLDGDLPYQYVMKVAESWETLGLMNAREAYEESINYMKRVNSKKERFKTQKDRQGEARPAWLDGKDDKVVMNETSNNDIDELLDYFNKRGEA